MKNPHAAALGRLGGLKKSPKKTAANQRNLARRWELYRARKNKNNV